MDEARQRAGWQQAAAVVCMIYNTTCDTKEGGVLTPEKVHPLAGVIGDAGAANEPAQGGERFKPEDARKIQSVFGDRKTVYKVKR